VLAITDQRVELSISVSEVRTLLIGTGEAGGVHPDGALPAGF
jgi:hypothetical protein